MKLRRFSFDLILSIRLTAIVGSARINVISSPNGFATQQHSESDFITGHKRSCNRPSTTEVHMTTDRIGAVSEAPSLNRRHFCTKKYQSPIELAGDEQIITALCKLGFITHFCVQPTKNAQGNPWAFFVDICNGCLLNRRGNPAGGVVGKNEVIVHPVHENLPALVQFPKQNFIGHLVLDLRL